MTFFEAFIIAVVEGLTEFLPISSTGHMILTSALLKLESSRFLNFYIIAIQLGAILSVVVLYKERFFKSIKFYLYLAAAVIPTAIIGLALKKYVDVALGSVIVVGINLFLGGIIMIFLERYFANRNKVETPITYKKAIWIGIVQALAIFPGVSRSAATIYGGLFQNLTRKTAAEFSFFLAVPVMFLATVKDLYDFMNEDNAALSGHEIQLLIFGNVVAFFVAMIAIKWFINFIVKYGFIHFAYYRIAIGLIVIAACYYFGFSLKMI